jgi:hypothetical protein
MAQIRIPKLHREALRKLSLLSEEKQSQVVAILNDPEIPASRDQVIARMADQSEFDIGTCRALVEAAISLYALADRRPSKDAKEITTAMMDAAQLSGASAEGTDIELFRKTIVDIVGSTESGIRALSRAIRMMWENQNTMLASDVHIEVRPIFPRPLDAEPANSVIVYILKVTHQTGTDTAEFRVAMDDKDIRRIIENLQGALLRGERVAEALADSILAPIPGPNPTE